MKYINKISKRNGELLISVISRGVSRLDDHTFETVEGVTIRTKQPNLRLTTDPAREIPCSDRERFDYALRRLGLNNDLAGLLQGIPADRDRIRVAIRGAIASEKQTLTKCLGAGMSFAADVSRQVILEGEWAADNVPRFIEIIGGWREAS